MEVGQWVGATWVSIPDRDPQPMVGQGGLGYGWVPQDSCPQEMAYKPGRAEAGGGTGSLSSRKYVQES